MKVREEKLFETLKKFQKELPHFPDGRIDYSHSNVSPVLTVFISVGEEILLLKRSDKVGTYKGKWNTVAGYLDEVRPLQEKISEELHEELSLPPELILKISLGKPYKYLDIAISKTWLIHPVFVTLKAKPKIKIDWEHTEYAWIKPSELKKYDVVPGLEKSYKYARM